MPFKVANRHPRFHMCQQWLGFLLNVSIKDFSFQVTQLTGEILKTMNEWLDLNQIVKSWNVKYMGKYNVITDTVLLPIQKLNWISRITRA